MNIESVPSCCGIGDIQGIDRFNGDGKGAMVEFCEDCSEDQGDWDYETHAYKPKPAKLFVEYGHYTFTGVVNHGHTYVQSFRSFIKRNRLGTVLSTRGRSNPNHPANQVVCCIWTPNKANLTRWWRKNGGSE